MSVIGNFATLRVFSVVTPRALSPKPVPLLVTGDKVGLSLVRKSWLEGVRTLVRGLFLFLLTTLC